MTALRKLFVAALTLTLPLGTLAQTATVEVKAEAKPTPPPPPVVQVYGTLNVNTHWAETNGATGAGISVAPRLVISADSSNVGVRGTLKLNDAVGAVYQCETGANIEGEALVSLCNRNSRVGLTGVWGTLAYGNWDTPMKSQHYGTKADDPFGNTDVFGFQAIMGSPGFATKTGSINNAAATAATGVPGWDMRGGNSLLWWTPKFAGITARVQYGVDEFRSADGLVDPMFLGAGLTFETGPFAIVGAAEYREDFFGIRTVGGGNLAANNRSAKDFAWRVAAGYDLPLGVGTLNVMGMFEQLNYGQEETLVGSEDWSRMAWLAGAKFRTGPHEFRVRYSQALDPDVTGAAGVTPAENELGAQHYTAGYAYHLAKSTQVYGFYSQLMNDDAARYTFGVAGSATQTVGAGTAAANAGVAPGADLLAIGLGIRHAF